MNIWLVQIGECLPLSDGHRKLRTSILAEELLERGHNVLWWGSAFDHFQKIWIAESDDLIKVDNNFFIKPLKGIGYSKNISLRRLLDHRIISWGFKKKAEELEKPDVIVVSMPAYDLAYQAVEYAAKYNIPVIVDIRDPWPDIFLKKLPEKWLPLGKCILGHEYKMLKSLMKKATCLTAVSSTFLNWGMEHAKREKNQFDSVFYLGYSPREDKTNKLPAWLEPIKDKFIITFIGTMGIFHNPEILIECAKKFSANVKYKNIVFVLAGHGDLYPKLAASATGLNNVIFPGWLNQDEISSLLSCSDLGVCSVGVDIDLFPNKAFLYLSQGLPVISAFKGDLKSVLNKYNAGFYYERNDLSAFEDIVIKLWEDNSLRQQTAQNAKLLFHECFDEKDIYDKYASLIEKVFTEQKEL